MHPPQHRRTHRGGCGGSGHQLRSLQQRFSLPSILLASVKALANKLDDLVSNGISGTVMTWLSPGVLDSGIQPAGGHCVNSNHLSGQKRMWQQLKIKYKNIVQNGKYACRLYKQLSIITLVLELSNLMMFINCRCQKEE